MPVRPRKERDPMEGWMIALIAVGGVLLILLLVLFCGTAQLRISCRDSVRVRLRVLGLRFRLYPRNDGEDEPRGFCRFPNRALARELRRQKRAEKRARKALKKKKKQAVGAGLPKPNVKENLEMIRALVMEFYRVSRGKITVRTLRLKVVVATGDAAKTALIWGGVSASASMLLNWINDHYAYIDHEPGEVDIRPDFAGSESGADIDLVFSLGLWSALRIALTMRTRFAEEKARAHIKAVRRLTRKAKKAVNQ